MANDSIQTLPEWHEVNLEQLSDNKKFSIVDGPFGTQLHADEYQTEGIPVVRVVNLSFEGKFINSNLIYVSEKKAFQLKRSKVIPRDIIIAKTGATIGKSGLFPDDYKGGIIASSCLKLTCNPQKAIPKLILYFISWNRGQKKIIDAASGSTRMTINISPFADIHFLLPKSLPEQSKIAEILSTVDEAIDKTEALIQKYQRIKQGLMQNLLTKGIDEKGNIRNEKTHKFKDSPFGRIPEEWEVGTFNDIAFINPSNPAVNKTNMKVTFLGMEDISEDGKIIRRRVVEYKKIQNGYTGFIEQDVLFAKITPCMENGKGALAEKLENGIGFGSTEFHVLRARNMNDPIFIYHYTLDKKLRISAKNNMTGTAGQQRVPSKFFHQYLIGIPRIEEQGRIASILSTLVKRIEAEQTYKQKLLSLKRGLMEDLLTGKVRVNHLLN